MWFKTQRAGQITSLFDKQQNREVLRAGVHGNVLKVFENKPMAYDNWDIDIYYTENSWEVDNTISMQWTETGPVRIDFALPVEKVFETDLLEQNPQPIPLKENAVTFTIKPYEIKTLRVIPRG